MKIYTIYVNGFSWGEIKSISKEIAQRDAERMLYNEDEPAKSILVEEFDDQNFCGII